MKGYYREAGDGVVMVVSGVIGVMSALVMLAVGVGFDVLAFGLIAYTVFMLMAVMCFLSAYAVLDSKVNELTARENARHSEKEHIFKVEEYYYNVNKDDEKEVV